MSSLVADGVWKALADARRRAMVDLLAQRPRTTGQLVAHFGDLCRTAVMRHLAVLEHADLVRVRRDGRARWNHFNPEPIAQVCDRWVTGHLQRSEHRMARLKAHVEGLPPKLVEPG
ncbi:MAG: metalloregulator ArsR/SmtB family transcription factor [Nannocystaceae bacterium]